MISISRTVPKALAPLYFDNHGVGGHNLHCLRAGIHGNLLSPSLFLATSPMLLSDCSMVLTRMEEYKQIYMKNG